MTKLNRHKHSRPTQSCFSDLDLFAPSVRLNFQQKPHYSTCFSTFASFVALLLVVGYLCVEGARFASSETRVYSEVALAEEDKAIDLQKLGFFFAVEKPDPRAGRIKAFRIDSGSAGSGSENEVNLIDCEQYLDDDLFANLVTESQQSLLKSQIGSVYEKKKFLCP